MEHQQNRMTNGPWRARGTSRGGKTRKTGRSVRGALGSSWGWGAALGAAAALLFSLTAASAKPPKPPPAPAPPGLIYYQGEGEGTPWPFYSMNADGSSKTQVISGLPAYCEPSRYRHEGIRWFLTAKSIAGETYPDGHGRYEIYAVAEDGTEIQLSDDPSVQPSVFSTTGGVPPDIYEAQVRWALGDTRVSWLGRRWGEGGSIVETGMYFIDLGTDVSAVTAPAEPVLAQVAFPISGYEVDGPVPDGAGYDWSPSGDRVVLGTEGEGLYVAVVGQPGMEPFAPRGWDPRWSPDGSSITFTFPGEGIATVPAASPYQWALVVTDNDRQGIWYRMPRWSPCSGFLTFERIQYLSQTLYPDMSIFRSTATGADLVELTPAGKQQEKHLLGWTEP
jgi:hypothetical protein